jgi:5-hydroxyisourate hydrolase
MSAAPASTSPVSKSLISTHVLDTARGRPASGVAVSQQGTDGAEIARGETDAAGRVSELGPESLPAGTYRLIFDTGAYFSHAHEDTFFPEVTLTFTVTAGEAHYHVPLLLSPFAYSTYRGN